jgi:hypothetical protein
MPASQASRHERAIMPDQECEMRKYLLAVLAALVVGTAISPPAWANCITRCDKNSQTCITDCN